MSPLSLLPLLPALLASGKAAEALKDAYDMAPVVEPVAAGKETLAQLVDSLPALHKSGKFKQMGDDLHSLWMIIDTELGDPAHMADVVKALKSVVVAGR